MQALLFNSEFCQNQIVVHGDAKPILALKNKLIWVSENI